MGIIAHPESRDAIALLFLSKALDFFLKLCDAFYALCKNVVQNTG